MMSTLKIIKIQVRVAAVVEGFHVNALTISLFMCQFDKIITQFADSALEC